MFYQIPGYILHSITRMWKKRRRVPGNHPNPKTSQSHGKWHHLKNRLQQIPEHQLWRPSVGTIKSGRDFAKLFCLSPSKASRKCEDAVHDLLARFLHGFVHEIWKQWPGKPTWPKSEFWPVRAPYDWRPVTSSTPRERALQATTVMVRYFSEKDWRSCTVSWSTTSGRRSFAKYPS